MLNRDRFLVAHGVDATRWAKRYGIEPASAPCHRCGVELRTTLPFAAGNLRGLLSPACECGFTGTPYCVVSAGGGDVLQALKSSPPPQEPMTASKAVQGE